MRTLLPLGLSSALLLPLAVRAQQPFAELGVQVEILSLTHGRFPEYFDNDSLRRIGSVIYDTRLERVAYLLPPDSLVGRAKSEITARWISVDPLAEKDAHISPYVFCADNAIRYKDPDGRIKIDPKTAKEHPALVAYAKGLAASYAASPDAFKKAFKEVSGLSNKQIKAFVTYGSGPTVGVKDLDKGSKQTNGETIMYVADKQRNLKSANDDGSPGATSGPGRINLDNDVVGRLENAKTVSDFKADTLLVESTLFHEETHNATGLLGTNEAKYDNANQEKGKAFEKKAYGEDVGRTNADRLANPSNAPLQPRVVNVQP